MSALRLLLVTDAVGGVWVYSLELARALRPLGIATILAVMGPSPSDRQRDEAADFKLIDTGLPLEWLDTNAAEVREAGEAIAALANRERADIVQTSSAALLAGADFGQPTVSVQHSCVAIDRDVSGFLLGGTVKIRGLRFRFNVKQGVRSPDERGARNPGSGPRISARCAGVHAGYGFIPNACAISS